MSTKGELIGNVLEDLLESPLLTDVFQKDLLDNIVYSSLMMMSLKRKMMEGMAQTHLDR
jgi:hypothetical protein